MSAFGDWHASIKLRLIEHHFGLYEDHIISHLNDRCQKKTDKFMNGLIMALVTVHARNVAASVEIITLLQSFTQMR